MAKMSTLISAIITITVSVIVVATVLAPQLATYTAEGGALHEYAGLLGAVTVMAIVGILMVAVGLVSSGKN